MTRILLTGLRHPALLLGLLLVGMLGGAFAQGGTSAVPAPGATLYDLLRLEPNTIRTLPKLPRVGAWGLAVGMPQSGEENFGIQVAAKGQAVIYPTTLLLASKAGTIEFTVKLPPAYDPAATQVRTLLDTIPATGAARILLNLQGNKLTLSWIDDGNQTKSIESTVRWAARTIHKLTLVWDAADVTLLVDGIAAGTIDAPKLFGREPLGITLGNSRDFANPSDMAVGGLRLSTAREPNAPANMLRLQDNIANEELSLKMAQGYDRSLYPLLEQLRRQNLLEVPFAYALAYADIGDSPRAMQAVTPLTTDQKHPLYLQAVFLRADLLTDKKDFAGAYDQLQVLATSPDKTVRIRAQVKQAEVLYEQGNKAEAIRLIGDIIARYPDMPAINDAYLVVGMDKFRSGSFQEAFSAFNSIGIPGAPPRQSVAIGKAFEIKVADADLNVRNADLGLPVTVTADSGDKEEMTLKPAFSRGVYLGSIETTLGDIKAGDGILQVRGNDKIKATYLDRFSAEGANIERMVALDLASDSTLISMAQSGLALFREAQEYQKKNILDENWEIVGTLPKTASKFFRDAREGSLLKKGTRLSNAFLFRIKAGQPIYVELSDPDEDKSNDPDTMQVEVTTQGGKKFPVTLAETGPHTGIFTGLVKTTLDGEPKEGMLEVRKNDVITTRYLDQRPAAGTRDPVHTARISIQMTDDGKIGCEREVLAPTDEDKNRKVWVQAVRVSNGTRVMVTVADRDLDVTDKPDTVKIALNTIDKAKYDEVQKPTTVAAPKTDTSATLAALKGDAPPVLELALTETDDMSGEFTGMFIVAAGAPAAAPATPAVPAPGTPPRLSVKPGDMVLAAYQDAENSRGALQHAVTAFRVNIAENATVALARQIIELPPATTSRNLTAPPPPKITWQDTDVLVPGSMYRVTVTDGDVIPGMSGQFMSKVTVKAANGAAAEVPLRGSVSGSDYTTVFTGEMFVRLGDTTSPSRAYFSQTGEGTMSLLDVKDDEEEVSSTTLWSVPAINIQGKDTVAISYTEPITADMKANLAMARTLRVAGDADIMVLNAKGNLLRDLKPGMAFELQVTDPNGDLTPKRDTIKAVLTSTCGDRLEAVLNETDFHSGIFSGNVPTVYATKGVPANTLVEVPFDGKITITYRDEETVVGTPADRAAELTTRPLMDAEGQLLTKVYDDPKFEVETLVRLGESLYAVGAAELAATAKPAANAGRTNAKLQEAARLLQEVIERFPTSQYVVESLFLTGKIRREERNPDAEKLFTRVIEEYSDSDFVPQALYQLVLLYYDQDDIDRATESAMRLVYGYPKNSMVADAVLRIAEYFYNKKKEYLTAAFIYKQLIERFPDNPRVDLITYRMATAYYRAGLAGDTAGLGTAIRYYLEFVERYKDHELADDALYWAANAYMKQMNAKKAFTMLTKLLITYPDGDMKPYGMRLRDKIKEDYPTITADAF